MIHAAGISKPRAVAVGYSARQRAVRAVETLRESYPDVPIYARAVDMKHAAELEAAGASVVITAETEAGLSLGSRMAQETLGVQPAAAATLKAVLREDMYARWVAGSLGGWVGGWLAGSLGGWLGRWVMYASWVAG